MQKAAPQAPEVPTCGAAFAYKKNHKLRLWKNRAVALMGRKRNSFWELQRRRPLPAAEAERSCWEPQPVGLPCSSPVPPTTKNPQTGWPGDHGGAFSTAVAIYRVKLYHKMTTTTMAMKEQEPSRGRRFSILENVVPLRDSFLLGRACPKPCGERVQQTGTCRGEAPPSCCARPFCRLKAPLGLSLFCFAPQTRIFKLVFANNL